ncbi:hypothetical protein [Methylobacterium sp. Leaf88]|uniref:phage head-tail joining protein n=1 Tax=Methylobacterium sp. Leaf88 TaxID=1736244 RepID=UPI0007011437|nr:hypothetical protein [Methylobacterium sp. Leaf88]KQO76436.1 hypothetical protein ASF20_13905 [Methylobacterium sp. Leaf88]
MAANIDKQIAALENAMASGALRVEAPDAATITYRSYDEMRQALSDLQGRKAAADAASGGLVRRRTRQIVTTGRSGW